VFSRKAQDSFDTIFMLASSALPYCCGGAGSVPGTARRIVEMLEKTQQELRDQRIDARRESSEARGQWMKILEGAGAIERGLWREVTCYRT